MTGGAKSDRKMELHEALMWNLIRSKHKEDVFICSLTHREQIAGVECM